MSFSISACYTHTCQLEWGLNFQDKSLLFIETHTDTRLWCGALSQVLTTWRLLILHCEVEYSSQGVDHTDVRAAEEEHGAVLGSVVEHARFPLKCHNLCIALSLDTFQNYFMTA